MLQRLRRLPASSPDLPAVLSRMDRALHCERYTPRPAFSMLLGALKLQLLTGSRDPIAQIVSQVSTALSAMIVMKTSLSTSHDSVAEMMTARLCSKTFCVL